MRTIGSVMLVLLVLACESEAASDADTILKLREASNAAIARHDAAAIGSFLSDDFVISISTGVIERSRDEHVESFAAHFEEFPDVVYVRTPGNIELSRVYPLAIETGEWVGTRTTEQGHVEHGGSYTAAWRRTESGWKIYSELYVGLYCRGLGCDP